MIRPVDKPIPAGDGAETSSRLGKAHLDAPTIYVFDDVLREMVTYSEQDLHRETGGFLMGGLHRDQRIFVEVRGFLPATKTMSRAASLTFTHDTWEDINRRASTEYPNDVMLGWHHTHPGLGVFLSAHDLFIHRHFFSQPWQIAMVVDPCSHQFGFFQWWRGKVVDCGFVWVRR